MATPLRRRGGTTLRGRGAESATLDRLVDAARAGRSAALVVRGEPGAGKTELLEEAASRAAGFRVVRAVGVESEMELPFAGLHQLCGPMLERMDRLAAPQRQALATAFGLSTGGLPDRFVVGLAVLGLLSEVAGEQPHLCIVDDVDWLDRASVQTLGFVARRLSAESVALVFGLREPSPELAGLPELVLDGLPDAAARALLESATAGPLDERVRDRLLAEARGNPLALLELPQTLTPAELAGGFGLPEALPPERGLEESFRRRLDRLPPQTRLLLLLAAAEPVGDPALLRRAAGRLALSVDAAAPAEADGLLRLGARVAFRHPLVRSVVYHAAPLEDRLAVHRALAEATDPEADPDRRAWHRAQGALGPDEAIAEELERSAARAEARGGLAAAAAFLERAAVLSPDPARRAARALAAAREMQEAGSPDKALELLSLAQAGPLDELQHALLELLRAQIALALRPRGEAAPLLLRAAGRLEALDVRLARETYLEAIYATAFAGPLEGGPTVAEVAEASRNAPAPPEPRPVDLLLDGVAVQLTEGYAAGAPMLRRALAEFRADDIRWHLLAFSMADDLWDDEIAHALAVRMVRLARRRGALTWLPQTVDCLAYRSLYEGDLAVAAELLEEARSIAAATGSRRAASMPLLLAAWRGRQDEVAALTEEARRDASIRGERMHVTRAEYASAVLNNGLGRYGAALAAARQAARHDELFSPWILSELIEAAARSGEPELALAAMEQLRQRTRASGTTLALGIECGARALVSSGEVADTFHRQAIDLLGRTRIATYTGRAHLLYGEWLRREGRRVEARGQLRTANELLAAMGADAFAERAARELLATGERARKRGAETRGQLTPQETQIAQLARDGHTNHEIGSQLFISPRTVEYHLHKVFTKLGIGSRTELHRVLERAGARRARPRTELRIAGAAAETAGGDLGAQPVGPGQAPRGPLDAN
jgi:DNA-binding CsgD family transcriptional regulator